MRENARTVKSERRTFVARRHANKQMISKDLSVQQKEWSERNVLLMRELHVLLNPLMDNQELDPEVVDTLGMLLDAASRSTESALLLMSFGKLWDAELLVRSALEASIKFVYIVQSKNDLRHRHLEYAEHQFRMAVMKDDQKARDALASVPGSSGPEWVIRNLVVPDAERDELRTAYDRAARRSMETRWGFTGLLDTLRKSGDPACSNFGGLFYGYTLSSHLQHADYLGISIALGQGRLEQPLRDSTQLSRLHRLIRDYFTCFELRLGAASRFADDDSETLIEARQQIDGLWAEMRFSNEAWLITTYGTGATSALPTP